MIGLEIKPKKTLKALQLVRIQVPIAPDQCERPGYADGVIFRVDPAKLVLRTVMDKLDALCTPDLPFVAWPLDHALIQIVCTKPVVAKLFKALFTQQRALGIRLTDLKSHVILAPMDPAEALAALAVDIFAALGAAGWHGLKLSAPDQPGRVLLGVNPLACADGQPHVCPRIEAQVGGTADAPVLLLVPSTVRFRHCTAAAFDAAGNLAAASRAAAGTLCRVLPTATPGIVDRLRRSEGPEAAAIEAEWARAGFALHPGAAECLVDVRFEEDEDAPATPFPAAAVLSFLGFDPVDAKLTGPGVGTALHRLRADLNGARFRLWGPGGAAVAGARRWDPERPQPSRGAAPPALHPAGKLGPGGPSDEPVETDGLGPAIDLEGLFAGGGAGGGGDGGGQGLGAARAKKPHARAGPELLAYLARLEEEEAREAAAAAAAAKPAQAPPPPRPAAPAPRAKNPAAALAALGAKKAPALGSKRPAPGAKAPAAKKPAAAKKAVGAAAAAGAAGSGGGAAAAGAAPKVPRAPKAPAPEIDVAALEVPRLAAAGTLGTLTIPQLKAYCRSMKQPVGGKKGDLEARIRAHLGLAAAGAAEA